MAVNMLFSWIVWAFKSESLPPLWKANFGRTLAYWAAGSITLPNPTDFDIKNNLKSMSFFSTLDHYLHELLQSHFPIFKSNWYSQLSFPHSFQTNLILQLPSPQSKLNDVSSSGSHWQYMKPSHSKKMEWINLLYKFASLTSHELQLTNGFGSGLSNLPPFSLSHSITTEAMFSFNLDGIWWMVRSFQKN